LILGATAVQSEGSDPTEPIVEGLAGLLVVGGGLALYSKIRANRIADEIARGIRSTNEEIAAARSRLEDLQELIKSGNREIETQKALSLATDEKELEIQGKLADLKNELRGEELLFGDEGDKIEPLRELVATFEDELANVQLEQATIQKNIIKASNDLKKLETSSTDLAADIKAKKIRVETLDQAEEIVNQDVQQVLDELVGERNIYDDPLFDGYRPEIESGEVNEVQLFQDMIKNDDLKYSEGVIERMKASLGEGFTDEMRQVTLEVVDLGGQNAFQALVNATCNIALSSKLDAKSVSKVASPTCTLPENIDPIVSLYSEEFTIEESNIFKGSHVFDIYRSDLADVGYEAQVGELVEYVAGPEFGNEAGGLIGAFTEGTLAAEDAVEALDIASIGLGGEAFAEGMALDVGGDALLGEIALDLIEIAIL
jgi:hypothetical protein